MGKQATYACIQPPPHNIKFNRHVYAEAAAALEQVQLNSGLQSSYSRILNTYFHAVEDRTVAYALFLNALDCSLKAAQHDRPLLVSVEGQLPALLKTIESNWTGTLETTLAMNDRKTTLLQESVLKAKIEDYRNREWFQKAAAE
jgi:hypothetical protein